VAGLLPLAYPARHASASCSRRFFMLPFWDRLSGRRKPNVYGPSQSVPTSTGFETVVHLPTSTRQLLNRLARLDVLLVDEFGYLNLKPEQSNTFFKLMEERYNRRSTIITSNLIYDEWHNFLGNKSMVDALLSRVRHYCHTVAIDGPSLRELQG
jgi:hypothetical protein